MDKAKLLQSLKNLMDVELEAERFYKDQSGAVGDVKLKKLFSKLQQDKLRHAETVQELVNFMKDYEHAAAHLDKIYARYPETASLFITTKVGNYIDVSLDMLTYLLKSKQFHVIHVSVSRSSKNMSKVLEQKRLPLENVTFVDVSGSDSISPHNLTALDIHISELLKSIKPPQKTMIYFDTVSAMYLYNSSAVLGRFFHAFINKARSHGAGLLLLALENEATENELKTIASFADGIVKL